MNFTQLNTEAITQVSKPKIETTKVYSKFKSLEGNRFLNKLHLKRLMQSMSQNYLWTVIVVNENYEIIDGQHRFEAIKALGLPLNYIRVKGYGLKEVQILNQNSRNWNADDFMNGYCDLGYTSYLHYRDFKKKYRFGHNECMTMLGGSSDNGANINNFKAGRFKVKNLKKAYDNAQQIIRLEGMYDGWRRRTFILAVLKLLEKDNFDFDQFLHKLKLQPMAMKHCVDVKQYIELIEHIYNYKSKDKVNLRY